MSECSEGEIGSLDEQEIEAELARRGGCDDS